MNRKVAFVTAALAVFAFACQSADAKSRRHIDKRLTAVSIGVGAASTATYFALNDWHWKWDRPPWHHQPGRLGRGHACAAVSPIVATAVLSRPLKYREAHILIGSRDPDRRRLAGQRGYDHRVLWSPTKRPPSDTV